jgi:hypothetical protein
MMLARELAEAALMISASVGLVFATIDWWEARKDWDAVRLLNGQLPAMVKQIARRDVRASRVSAVGFLLIAVGAAAIHFADGSYGWNLWPLAAGAAAFCVNVVADARVRWSVLLSDCKEDGA